MKKFILFAFIILLTSISLEARQPQRGYRGFLEWSSSYRSENYTYLDWNGSFYSEREGTFFSGVTTSHGYQINPTYFIGIGVGMERCGKIDRWIAPIFMEGRADLQFGKYTPFGDIRLGANMADGAGFYFSPTIGYRFNWGRKMGVNLGLGLTLAGYRMEYYEGSFTGPDSYEIHYVKTKHPVDAYFSFRVGIDF